jgi:tRNA (guanine9-N1)-methyltransferase
MEAEERPSKIRKLSYDAENESEGHFTPETHCQEHRRSPPPGNLPERPEAGDEPPKKKRSPPPNGLSRSAYKKLLKQQEWEAGKGARRIAKKAKEKLKKQEKRAAKQEAIAKGEVPVTKEPMKHIYVPVTFIFDCNFDDLMFPAEIKSLASQITRCYSDNGRAPFRAHLAVASFSGRLKDRFDDPLQKQHERWMGIKFLSEDFVEVSKMAKGWMQDPDRGGQVAGALTKCETDRPLESEGEVIYLSSDSDNTIEELKPYNTYIIGGLVDRNRHKGICYKSAVEKGIKTAKLPIGEFLDMDSRKVLTTNHVNEIMLQWLELGNWGEAFMKVIPKRKGGSLRTLDAEVGKGKDIELCEDDNEFGPNDEKTAVSEGEDDGESIEPRNGNDDGGSRLDAAANTQAHGDTNSVGVE